MPKPSPANLTRAEARKAARWFSDRLGIEDWTIRLQIQDVKPDWAVECAIGCCSLTRQHKHANVWVSSKLCVEDDRDDLGVLFHELLHVVWEDCSEIDHSLKFEFTWNKLGDLLAAAYRKGV